MSKRIKRFLSTISIEKLWRVWLAHFLFFMERKANEHPRASYRSASLLLFFEHSMVFASTNTKGVYI